MARRSSIGEIESGDRFKVVRGSKAGVFGVTGSLVVEELTSSATELVVDVGKFGFNVEVRLRMERRGDEVDVVASGSAFDTIRSRGEIVTDEPAELRIRDLDGALADTHLVLEGDGTGVVESEIPIVGRVRLMIEPG
ncbi:MAG: hypothetical protein KDC46_03445 [Thermoleophilia bacterium]|nr:hypothetical protein [Thermoleophilia bacterium]